MNDKNVFDVLKERGYLAQVTHEEEVRELLASEPVTFYIGFDPTADSLHVGHFIQVMVMMHMQRAGHRPIAMLGGGTALVGDPSGKTDMRKMMTRETVEHNGRAFKGDRGSFFCKQNVKCRMFQEQDGKRSVLPGIQLYADAKL